MAKKDNTIIWVIGIIILAVILLPKFNTGLFAADDYDGMLATPTNWRVPIAIDDEKICTQIAGRYVGEVYDTRQECLDNNLDAIDVENVWAYFGQGIECSQKSVYTFYNREIYTTKEACEADSPYICWESDRFVSHCECYVFRTDKPCSEGLSGYRETEGECLDYAKSSPACKAYKQQRIQGIGLLLLQNKWFWIIGGALFIILIMGGRRR